MQNKPTYQIKTLSDYHKVRGLPNPQNPLISVIDCAAIQHTDQISAHRWMLDFYAISLKRTSYSKAVYGQQEYDFDDGILYFSAPKQIFSFDAYFSKSDPSVSVQTDRLTGCRAW